MVIVQEPAQSVAALDGPFTINVPVEWEKQDVVFALMIALCMVVLNVFVEGSPQRALAK